MEHTYKKISDNELEVTKVLPAPEPIINRYERRFIKNQIQTIKEDRDNYIALRNAEIEECRNILAEMDRLKIVTKVDEVIKEI